MSIEAQLSDFAIVEAVDGAALEMMRLSLFDWAACGIAGASEPLAGILRGHVGAEGGTGSATVIGGAKAPPRASALVNGATSHALDYDDTHFAHIGHPSVAVIPAALAMAEVRGADMAALLQAALVGTEGSVRIGLWLGRGHYAAGFHQTATAGAFGATLSGIRLTGLHGVAARRALGIAASRAGGVRAQFGTMAKPLNAGLAAETGVEATLLAVAGFESAPEALSGPQGYGETHLGEGHADAFDGLGHDWRMLEISHKFHACCHGLHAMLEAVGTLKVDPQDVIAVTIRTHPRWMTVCNNPDPSTGLQAKFSYRLSCAMALAGVPTAAISSFTDAACAEPRLVALRDSVQVEADDSLTEMQARVSIETRDGAQQTAFHDLAAPIPFDLRAQKLRLKAEGLLGTERADRLWQAVHAADLGPLLALLAAA
ncbi:MAG: MmgE/PrpD family protein [Limimaricola sp.]|uniref:MmgE/PrpD family protein n=1 Tax=Limimaricola sp. TaxID=2211665 RepID=UPI001D41D250|nr:MmgE/PrpD family protein [Limimaricola sp.]MBI1418119.1 MmgE/PrpD family protein [Limimaricola sp.]